MVPKLAGKHDDSAVILISMTNCHLKNCLIWYCRHSETGYQFSLRLSPPRTSLWLCLWRLSFKLAAAFNQICNKWPIMPAGPFEKSASIIENVFIPFILCPDTYHCGPRSVLLTLDLRDSHLDVLRGRSFGKISECPWYPSQAQSNLPRHSDHLYSHLPVHMVNSSFLSFSPPDRGVGS